MGTDFLKYDSTSIKELLRRKLIESGLYTDQIYPGSDTSLLIDLFSWTFETLMYIVNENASDALFGDSSIYENLNKIVKLLSYDPRAYTTSNAEFSLELANPAAFENETVTCVIPKFASITSPRSDKNGNQIKYSFIEDYSFNIVNGTLSLSRKLPILYNGYFVKYTFNEEADGHPYEVFTMKDVGPEADEATLIDNNTLHVYVENAVGNGYKTYDEVKIVKSLVVDATPSDLACEARLNERKEFEFKFGDGLHGKTLTRGSTLHVVYLKSNGPEGIIDAGALTTSSIELEIKGFNSKVDMIDMIYEGAESFKINYSRLFTNGYVPKYSTNDIVLSNLHTSSNVLDYESWVEMREFAPSNFRVGNRLVTANDFRTFIMQQFRNRIVDAYVCNNNEYCSLFYKWLDRYGSFNSNIRLNSYEYADACDFNNIYIWLKPASSILAKSDKDIIVNECNKIKSLTTALIPCDGVKTYFMPFAQDSVTFEMSSRVFAKSFTPPSKIVIKKYDTYYSDGKIRSEIAEIIKSYFEKVSSFGATINLADLQTEIYGLGYVESIKTFSTLTNKNGYYSTFCNGLSFATFTSDLISFRDFSVFTQQHHLEKFQYPVLLNPDKIITLIEIVNKDSFTLSNNEF